MEERKLINFHGIVTASNKIFRSTGGTTFMKLFTRNSLKEYQTDLRSQGFILRKIQEKLKDGLKCL